jgi:hypothetical protein
MIPEKPASARALKPSNARGDGTEVVESPSPVCGAPRGITGPVVVVTGLLCFFVAVDFFVVVVVDFFVVVVVDFFVVVAVDFFVVVVVDFTVVVVVVEVGVEEEAKQVGTVMVLESSVTAPFRASTLPCSVAPVSRVADVSAMMVPTKLLAVPRVAELPTCQKTLHACAPFSSATLLPDAEIKVEPAWKIKTASASPPPLRVTVPVSAMADATW